MPRLIEKATGKAWEIPSTDIEAAISSGLYDVPEGTKATVVDPVTGIATDVAAEQVGEFTEKDLRAESVGEERGRENAARIEREHGGVGGAIKATLAGGARGLTFGGSDVFLRAMGVEAETLRDLETAHPVLSTGGEVVGALGAGVAGAGKLGAAVAKKAGGGIVGGIAGGAAEGALYGAGAGVSELALSDDPLTVERAVSALSSNMLLGAAGGAAVGGLAKAAEKGLARGKRLLESVKANATPEGALAEGQSIADDVLSLRQASKDSKVWIATEDKSLRKVMLKADRTMDSLTDNLKGLSQRPQRAIDSLQRNEQALQKLIDEGVALRQRLTAEAAEEAADGLLTPVSSNRLKALKDAETLLERNRALQSRIQTFADAATTPAAPKAGLLEKTVEGTLFGATLGALPTIPVLGSVAAPMIAGKVAEKLTGLVFGRFGKLSAETAQRSAQAVQLFMNATAKVAPVAPPLASKVLTSVQFGETRESTPAKGESKLVAGYRAREKELRELVVDTPAGPQMRLDSRRKIAEGLTAVRAVNPILADKMETVAARRVEFLASKLPRRPDFAALQLGPDRWRPSELQMREFARYVAAVEDPAAVEERLVTGQITPEDAEAYREVYPERFEDFKRQVIEQLPKLRASLPYKRRVALSIFTGVPVDPAMHPAVLRVLQSQYTTEPGTEGGMQAPKAAPQFGSVSKPEATPAQERAK